MKYRLYSQIPDSEKILLKGSDIKYNANVDDSEILVIKDNKFDHIVYFPYDEIDDNELYNVYEDGHISGSGICYMKIFIF